MKKGRLTKEEQGRRIKLLLNFIFTFRYAIRKQLDMFIWLNINLKYPQWLIEYTLKQGYINAYYEPTFRTKIYYLTQKAKDLLYDDEALIKHYHFDRSYAGVNTHIHHNILIEVYFLLKSRLNIKEWVCEWVLRVGIKRNEKIPDGLIVLPDGTKIALEVESRYKKISILKNVIAKYHYDIEKISRYHCVLIVAFSRLNYEGLKKRLYTIAPEFCADRFILTDLGMLEEGTCFYQDKLTRLEEALTLLRQKG